MEVSEKRLYSVASSTEILAGTILSISQTLLLLTKYTSYLSLFSTLYIS